MKLGLSLTFSIFLLCGFLSVNAYADILKMDIKGPIGPITVEVIQQAIHQAESEKATVLLIQLQTLGGMLLSMEDIISRILSSKVPIVIYVAPSGAKAASAGFFLLLSADIAAMAPGTNTGAAHPILSAGGFPVVSESAKPFIEKVTNDAAASLRSIAKLRGRNPELAEKGVRESKSFTAEEALEGGLIDLLARDQAELLDKLDGRRLKMLFTEDGIVLHTRNNRVRTVEMSSRIKFWMFVTYPTVAVLFLIAGILLLYFEFTHPGFIAPGVIGGICLLLALLGFHMLPINYVGALLILLALGLFIAEVKIGGFGIIGAGGVIAMVLGVLMLVDTTKSEVGIDLKSALSIVLPFAVFFMLVSWVAFKSARSKPVTGEEGLIGLIGYAYTPVNPDGKVFVHGELWNAESKAPIEQGKRVKILGIRDLKLKVEETQE